MKSFFSLLVLILAFMIFAYFFLIILPGIFFAIIKAIDNIFRR